MKLVILFLAVVSCTAATLTCKEGTNVTETAGLTDKTCDAGVTKCFKPKANVDNNSFMNYGCGECDAKDAASCATCAADKCNTLVARTYAHKCYVTKNTTKDCTGLSTAGCFTSFVNYTGARVELKGTFGGCGMCNDTTTFSKELVPLDLANCTSCAGAECNKPTETNSATQASLAGLSFLLALCYLI